MINQSPRPLKILYHHRTAAGDGQRVHITEMIKAFQVRGHSVCIVGPLRAASSFQKENKVVPWMRRHLPNAIGELLELFYSLRAFYKLRRCIVREKPDFIYERANLFLLSGVWAAQRYHIPLILEVNAPLTQERSSYGSLFFKKLALWSEQKTWRGASHILPVSEVLADIIRSEINVKSPITVIHNGIDISDYNQSPFSPANQSTEPARRPAPLAKAETSLAPPIIGFIGFIRDWHQLNIIIDVLARDDCPEYSMEIVGDGPALASLKDQVKRLNLNQNIIFKGKVGREDVPALLQTWDIAVQPAVTAYASPLKIFEYMAAGLAIIAPNQPNIREILTHEKTALLFDCASKPKQEQENIFDIATTLITLLKDSRLQKRLGAAAKNDIICTPYTWENNARLIENIYTQININR